MDNALKELITVSNTIGTDSSLVLGSFGNASVKAEGGRYMYIKTSGTALKDMSSKLGWRRLEVRSVKTILKDKSIAETSADKRPAKIAKRLLSACSDRVKPNAKPSVESCFHSILDRCVIHLHPVAVLAYVCAKNGRIELERLFRQEKFPPLWVPYADPGYALAKQIERLTQGYENRFGKCPSIMFLQNHGLVVTSGSSDTALQLVRRVITICKSKLKRAKAGRPRMPADEVITCVASAIRRAFLHTTGAELVVRHFIDRNIAAFMAKTDAAKLCSLAAVTPDELVYAHGPAVWLDRSDQKVLTGKLNRKIAAGHDLPVGFLIRPLGLFVAGRKEELLFLKEVISTYLAVRGFAAGFGSLHCLSKRQREFIVRMYA